MEDREVPVGGDLHACVLGFAVGGERWRRKGLPPAAIEREREMAESLRGRETSSRDLGILTLFSILNFSVG